MEKLNHKKLKRLLRSITLSILVGVLSGGISVLFLRSLNWATQTREAHKQVIWLLPIAGLLIGWIYSKFGEHLSRGNNLIIEEVQTPRDIIPFKLAPLIFLTTIVSHLFGASTGREGAVVQLGATLSDRVSKLFNVQIHERKNLLAAGASAAFGSALGAPWAGVLFGLEFIDVDKLHLFAILECLVASFSAYLTTSLLKYSHTQYSLPETAPFQMSIVCYVVIAGIIFGLAARLFILTTKQFNKIQTRLFEYPPYKAFFGGLILAVLFNIKGMSQFSGLGIATIQKAFTEISNFSQPFFKLFFSALSISSGFKGGEFMPLVYIGTTLGSALSLIIPISIKLLAALGFVAVFAGAANTPIACSIMAIELFGPTIAPYAFFCCFTSYLISGKMGIYESQRFTKGKNQKFFSTISFVQRIFINKKVKKT